MKGFMHFIVAALILPHGLKDFYTIVCDDVNFFMDRIASETFAQFCSENRDVIRKVVQTILRQCPLSNGQCKKLKQPNDIHQ
jgi:hypothetical protein